MWSSASWLIHHWYWPAAFGLLVFAWGFYRNWRHEKRRMYLTDAELRLAMGDEARPREDLDARVHADALTRASNTVTSATALGDSLGGAQGGSGSDAG